jgi:hypothetical protein
MANYAALYNRLQDEELHQGPVFGPLVDIHIEAQQMLRSEPFLLFGTKFRAKGYFTSRSGTPRDYELQIELTENRWQYGGEAWHFLRVSTEEELDRTDSAWRTRIVVPSDEGISLMPIDPKSN